MSDKQPAAVAVALANEQARIVAALQEALEDDDEYIDRAYELLEPIFPSLIREDLKQPCPHDSVRTCCGRCYDCGEYDESVTAEHLCKCGYCHECDNSKDDDD